MKINRLKDHKLKLNVNGTDIKSYDSITLLGVDIDNALNFSGHISDICKKSSQRVGAEAYHLEAINSDPMLGFFSEPIKIYFLIWSVAHLMSRYRRLCRSNGGHGCSFRVDQLVCRFSTFFCAHQENQTIFFGAASAISSL